MDFGSVRGTQFLEPLFEFSGACAGCGETPYLKLLSQLFGDRLTIANATGCSSIYGGNLPTTPWTSTPRAAAPPGRTRCSRTTPSSGSACGWRPTATPTSARRRLNELRDRLGDELVDGILDAQQLHESELRAQRERIAELERRLEGMEGGAVDDLRSVIDHLIRRSVWIVGGDGWAFDIGSGGVDHVLASGRDVNVLVLDTEVYSNTGGQMSKATPLGAVAKFAAAGKTMPTKDLALQAISLRRRLRGARGDGRRPAADAHRLPRGRGLRWAVADHRLLALHRARLSTCSDGLDQQYRAVASGHWPLIRYDPVVRAEHGNPFLLDSPRPRMSLADYRKGELRFRALASADPAEAERLLALAQEKVDQRWELYEEMATRSAEDFPTDPRRNGA